MNQLQIFKNSQFGEVRVATQSVDGAPLFCLADLCDILYLRQGDVRQRLGDDVVSTQPILDNMGRTQYANFVNEEGLYDVILDSRKPEARQFRKWIISEVLPSIRKHGAYMTEDVIKKTLSDPDFIIRLATELKAERRLRAEEQQKRLALETQNQIKEQVIVNQNLTIRQQAPKVEYHDKVLQSSSLIATTIIAKELGMSGMALNKKLKQLNVIYSVNNSYALFAKYQGKGLEKYRTVPYIDEHGIEKSVRHLYWTEKGRKFILHIIRPEMRSDM